MRFVLVDETPFHMAFRPPADGAITVMFSNSLGTDFRIWSDVVAMLPASLGILLYDTRAHGLSGGGQEARGLARHVDDMAGLVAAAGVGRHVVCGLSVGGVIAQAYALRRPDGLAGLILSNTAAKVATPEVWQERIAAVEAGGIEALADAVMERWFSPRFRQDEAATVAGMRAMLTRQTDASYMLFCALLAGVDLRAEVSDIAVPTLAIAGETDLSTPPALVEELAAAIPGAAFTLIPGAGHIPCVEAPRTVAETIGSFLRANGLAP